MARKSNKTSHVLHLLAGEEPIPETAEEKEETAKLQESVTEQEPEEPESDTPNISIVSAGNSEGDPLADLIREQLEEDFPEEILNTQPANTNTEPPHTDSPSDQADSANEAQAPEPAQTEAAQAEPKPETKKEEIPSAEPEQQTKTDSSTEPEPVQTESKKEPETAQAEPAEEPKDPPPTDGAGNPAHYRFVNVMEYIIKDMLLDYMHKFDMCTCERCQVDTMALALTNCPAKYIVVDNHTVSPLLNYYSNKYMGTVTVELIKACTMVKENPRH